MHLSIHLLIHFLFSLLAGAIVWKIWKKPEASFLAGIVGGFFIDADHLIDYFLIFGFNFDLNYFFSSYQFIKGDSIFVFFHGWEYLVILLIGVLIFKNKVSKSIFLALFFGMFFHLSADVFLNEMDFKFYSIFYRSRNNFEMIRMVNADRWKEHLFLKQWLEDKTQGESNSYGK